MKKELRRHGTNVNVAALDIEMRISDGDLEKFLRNRKIYNDSSASAAAEKRQAVTQR